MRRWIEAVNNGTWREAADTLYTTTFVGHTPYAPAGLAAGPQGAKDVVAALSAGFPDYQLTVEDMIGEGDKVTARYTVRATHRGAFMGIAPTGKHVTLTSISINRIEEGKMAEMWDNSDVLALLQQLGAIPEMAQGGA
jgi:predicted ester cyclase